MSASCLSYNISPNATDPAQGGDGLPVGAITLWGTGTAPSGWLMCDGSKVSRNTYADLFSVIGTTWGAGDGTPIPMSYTNITVSTSILNIYMVSVLSSSWTLGTVFTMTGGRAAYSTYVWTVSTAPNGLNHFSATATLAGVAVTNLPSGTDSTAGNIFITNPTNFTLPDTGNKTIRGINNVTILPNDQAGSDSTSVTLFAANLPPHRHGFTNYNTYTTSSAGSLSIGGSSVNTQFYTNAGQTYAEDGSTAVTSLPFSVDTTNVYVAIPYIIKYA